MKYIIMCLIAAAVCLATGWLLTALLNRKGRFSGPVRILLSIAFAVLLMAAAAAGYLGIYSHADEEAFAALDSDESVQVTQVTNGWYFDGPGEDAAIIFYPGAKVETEAYAPLLHRLAREGEDCFLVSMPFHMAIFGMDRAEDIIQNYDYDSWYLAGHSMGGMTAALYVCDHPDQADGLILLAAYSTKKLPDEVRVCSIYGSEDGCLDRKEYAKMAWPAYSREVIITGGNHARFGNYGMQKGDGQASVSAEEQQKQTAAVIKEWIDDAR